MTNPPTRPTQATVKRLFAVSGNRCAFPECPNPLIEPNTGSVSGEICHIEAQNANGPRYNPKQTDEERHSFSNLILMCPIHHKVIDDKPDTYTVVWLQDLKAGHEARYAGGREPSDDIARQFLFPAYSPPPPPDPDDLPEPGALPPGSRLPFHRNALFTGRVELMKALARALLHDGAGSTLITQAVQGMGGVGKTQLAVEFAWRYGRYFRGVHWLNAAQPDLLAAEVALCGAEMGLPHWPEEQPEQVRLTLQVWRGDGRYLIILDNLEEVETAREWLPRLGSGGVRLLLTARRSDWPRDLGLGLLRLRVFRPEESMTFLRRSMPEERGSDADLASLAERLGHLPLALQLSGRYLERLPRVTVPNYLEKLDEVLAHPSMAGWRADLGDPVGHDLDLAATFTLSWERVEDEAARQVFLLAGYCAPNQAIPYKLLESATGLGCAACDEALSQLAGLGLLDWEGDEGSLTIHPLLAEYAQTLAKEEKVLALLAEALGDLTFQALESGLPGNFIPLRPHLEVAVAHAEGIEIERTARLWSHLGAHLHDLADYAGARSAYERALAISKAIFGHDHLEVARNINGLGLVLKDLGDYPGARRAFERVLYVLGKTLPQEHPYVATTINNLGGVLNALEDHAGAQAALERALAINEAVFGPDSPEVASSVNGLGSVMLDLGDHAGARAAFERALAINEAVFGPDHPEVARNVSNLGLVLQDLGDYIGARVAYERALAINETVFGSDHPEVASSINSLGMVLRVMGDHAGARAAFERALAINEAVFGPDHPEVATDVNNLGSVLHDLGEHDGARVAFERALGILDKVLPPEHSYVVATINNLGMVLYAVGDYTGARAAFERVLGILDRTRSPEHPYAAATVNNLGMVLDALRDHAGARAAYERALIIWRAAYGENHPQVAIGYNNLGNVLQALGDHAGARTAYERALTINEGVFGSEHPSLARGINNLGGVLKDMGDHAGARAAFERALAILEQFLPPDHPNIRIVRGNLEALRPSSPPP